MLQTLRRLQQYFSSQNYSWSVQIISDGSTDSTTSICKNFSKKHPEFDFFEYHPNKGKGYAVRCGMLRADSEWVLFSDADLAAPIEEIEKLFDFGAKRFDVIIGSRPLKESQLLVHQPFYREFLGRVANKLIQLLAVRGIQDTQCGFKLFKECAAKGIFSRCQINGFSFDIESLMIGRELGYKIAEVPIRWAHQEGSKVRIIPHYFQAFWDLILLRLQGRKKRLQQKKAITEPVSIQNA